MVAIVTPPRVANHAKGRADYPKNGHRIVQKPAKIVANKTGNVKMTAASSAVRIRLLYHIIRRQAEQRARRLKQETSALVKPKAIRYAPSATKKSPRNTCGNVCDCQTCYIARERFQKSARQPSPYSQLSPVDDRAKQHLYYDNRSVTRPYSPMAYYNALILNSLRAYHMKTTTGKNETAVWRPWM